MAILPSTHRGKKNQKRVKLQDSFERLLVFKKNSTLIQDFNFSKPIIFCSGESEKDKNLTFNVFINDTLLPESESALVALDLLFKAYVVFEIDFDEGLVSFFSFLKKFVYAVEADEIVATPHMKLIKNYLKL